MTLYQLMLLLLCWYCTDCFRISRSYAMNMMNYNSMFGVYGGYIPCERGTCTSSQYCQQARGQASGFCYLPQMSTSGVCCSWPCFAPDQYYGYHTEVCTNINQVREACGQTTADDIVIFRNPNYPQPNSQPINCALTLNVKMGTCGVRVDFLETTLAPLVAEACIEDSVTILHRSEPPSSGYNVPFCGLLGGISTVIQVVEQSQLEVVVTTQSSRALWSIRLVQINCSLVQAPAIQGCGIPNQKVSHPGTARESQDAVFFRKKHSLRESRILGGYQVKNAYPWVVVLLVDQMPQCGGSLITNEWVLTAGHCLTVQELPIAIPIVNRFMVILGVTNISKTQEMGRMTRSVANIVRHPEYIVASNDIGLVRLTQPVTYSQLIRPVCLPITTGETYADQQGIIAGWGFTSNNATMLPHLLMVAQVTILNNSYCRQLWSSININIDDSMLCAGLGIPATCRGDSGGPLVVTEGPGMFYSVVAITSFGARPTCGSLMYPDVWTRVTYYLDWIYLVLTNI